MQTSWCVLMSIICICLLALILKFKISIFAEIIHNCFGKYSNLVLSFTAAVKTQNQPTKQKPENLLFLLLLILFPELVGW